MPVALKSEPTLLVAGGSHWLELENGPPRRYADGRVEPFAREELFPILEVEAPRVGTVRARFSVDRYVSSNYDEKSGTSSALWGDWRMILRDVRLPDPVDPSPHTGRPAPGVGDATRRAIVAACGPVIRSWLDGEEYLPARRAAAAYAVKRELADSGSRGLLRARRMLEEVDGADALSEADSAELFYALDLLEKVSVALDKVPVNPND